jgi:hypothetical protein
MKMSWRTETGRLLCRWSEAGEHIQYNPRWIQDASRSFRPNLEPPVPAFTRLSPFAGAEWYGPHRPR